MHIFNQVINFVIEYYKSKQNYSNKINFFQYGSNNHILHVKYNGEKTEEVISNGRGQLLLNVKYKNGVLPVEWSSYPRHNCFQAYDR
jgi:hypothetical protein